MEQEVIANLKKPIVPNVNIPERIIICLDMCTENSSTLYHIGDGTSFTPINMIKRILEFFIHGKHAINNKTQFALLILNDCESYWALNFTSNLREIFTTIDQLKPELSTFETFDFSKVFDKIKSNVTIPTYKEDNFKIPLSVVRTIVIYCRSNCIPVLPQENEYYSFLKKQLYFYIDILFTHEENCALNKCEEIFSTLQELDNGYSHVYEVSRNARKIHECISKLLAHPLQRPLQRNTDYTFEKREI